MPPERPNLRSLAPCTPIPTTPPTSALRSLYGSRSATPSLSPSASRPDSPIPATPTSISMDCDTPDTSFSFDSSVPDSPSGADSATHALDRASSTPHSPVAGTLWNGSDFPAAFYRACRSLKPYRPRPRSPLTHRFAKPLASLSTGAPPTPTGSLLSPSPLARPSSAPVEAHRSSSASLSPPPCPAVSTPPEKAATTSKPPIELPRRATETYMLSRIAHVRPANSVPPDTREAATTSSSTIHPSLPARMQHPKSSNDLYTPRYVRGGRSAGAKGEQGSKEGWCALCVVEAEVIKEEEKDQRAKEGSWHNLRNSSYRYHLLRIHGVSSKSCTLLEPPLNIRPAAAQPVEGHELQGRCHRCCRWITFSDKPPATSWFVHAASCHRLVPLTNSEPEPESTTASPGRGA